MRVSSCPDTSSDSTDTESNPGYSADDDNKAQTYHSLTVLVYSFCQRDYLAQYMERLMAQDYPNFRVVLICDASRPETTALTEDFVERYGERFYATFVPPGSLNLSRRKLAITLGMKACDSDYVITTSSNCDIPSDAWLSEMMNPVNADPQHTSIVLGYCAYDFEEFTGISRWYKQFLSLCTSAQWLGAALNAKAYRGNGFNLLMRRDLFFEQKGYSATIHLENGEDDLFVNSIARPDNTAVQLNRNAILTTRWGASANRIWSDHKERYDFTKRWLPKAPFFRAAVLSSSQWVMIALLAIITPLSFPNLFPTTIALLLIVATFLSETLIYRRTASRLDATRLWWSLPWFMLWKPIGNFFFHISHHHNIRKNYTWQRRRR